VGATYEPRPHYAYGSYREGMTPGRYERPYVCGRASGTQLSRHRVRAVLCTSAFLAIPPLPSIDSATSKPVLFADFLGTTSESDLSRPCITGYGSSHSRHGPAQYRSWPNERSPGSRAKSVRACQGLGPRGVGQALALARRSVLPSASVTASAPRKSDFRGSMAGLRVPPSTLHAVPHDTPRMTRGQCDLLRFTVRDSHPLVLAGLPAHY